MFSFFKKKPKGPDYSDVIWLDTKSKQLQFITFVKQESDKRSVFIISSFQESLNDIEAKLTAVKLALQRVEYVSDIKQDNSIFLLDSKCLLQNEAAKLEITDGLILFLEHYPMFDQDIILMEKATQKLNSTEITFYLSLDDPLFSLFGGERIKKMIMQLNVEKDEPIQHPMISKSLLRAQKKITEKVVREQMKDSEAQWYASNFKED